MGTTSTHTQETQPVTIVVSCGVFNIELVVFHVRLTCGELADVVADTNKHAGSFEVVSSLHVNLHKNTFFFFFFRERHEAL